jgi:cyclopropane-fatty-acyl-phospholipid synthase
MTSFNSTDVNIRPATTEARHGKMPRSAALFLRMLKALRYGRLHLITPDGEVIKCGDDTSSQAIVLNLHDWRACGQILRNGDIGFAESYKQNWISTSNLTGLLRLAIHNENALDHAIFGNRVMNVFYRLKHILRPNTRKGSKKNIHAHYDIGNPFYRLWLDSSWTYSSAVFAGDFSLSLEQAQAQKYQRIIDVLQLKAGQKVLEIGCGWGGFAVHAARLGIQVHGITISEAQLEIAQQRVSDEKLNALVELEIRDYRDLQGQYDAIVSIEMFEAVGERYWKTYFSQLNALLKPHAKAMVQTITIDDQRFERYRSNTDFIQQYIFPGGMLPSPQRFVHAAAKQNLLTCDQYAFGKDYAETLRRWSHDFEARLEEVSELGFDLAFQRIWQLYYAYCEAGFEEARTDVVQFVLQKQD